jgi:wyosine [tRNA(Phe)-imidazoG37] synthetase (radical SAM superfamily)
MVSPIYPQRRTLLELMKDRHAMKTTTRNGNRQVPLHPAISDEVAFGYPRDFLQNQFVYLVISPRAKGLSIGVNLNPIMRCNFHCLYCEVERGQPARACQLDTDRLSAELDQTLRMVEAGWLRHLPRYANLPEEMLQVRHVTLSGDGEPTSAEKFVEAVGAVAHVRARGRFFKIVLVTNSTGLDSPRVHDGLKFFTSEDEVGTKLDGGTDAYIRRVNGSMTPLEKILSNILLIGRQRPVVIQSLFPAINGEPPSDFEIDEYAQRLKELKEKGAQISQVQIYSATRPMALAGCTHLPLRTLSRIAQTVRKVSGLKAEVF